MRWLRGNLKSLSDLSAVILRDIANALDKQTPEGESSSGCC